MNSNAGIIERIGKALLNNDKGGAKDIIEDEYKFTYINLSDIFNNNPKYFSKSNNFTPNIKGYEKISQIIVEKIKNN